MPNLYTSLLDRRLGTRSLAPQTEPPPVPKDIASQPIAEWKANISDSHRNAFAEMVSFRTPILGLPPSPAPARPIGIIGAGLAGLATTVGNRRLLASKLRGG